LLFVVLIVTSLKSSFAQPPNYNFGKQILVNSSQVSGTIDLSNFVMLVSLIDPDLRTTTNGGSIENANGYDIIFTLGDCSTILDHQIEEYNPATGEYIAWVKIPTLFASMNTNIHMYYGNSTIITNPSTTDVWGTEYAAVWHMNQSPAAAAPQIEDHSPNTNDGITNGGMVAADLVNGHIGQGIDFDGSNDFIDCGSDASTDPNGSITVSAWIYSRAPSGHIINRGGGWNDPGYSLFHLGNQIRIELQRSGEKDMVDNGITTNQWHYVALTYDNVSGTIRCYIDGVEQGNTGNHTGPMGNPVENLNIGRKEQNAYYFDGIIDEGRVIHDQRDGDWMLTEYNNQNNPSAFYTVSAEMSASTFCVLLPVEFIDFNAHLNYDIVNLEWQTASELNNEYFSVERSSDLHEWEKVQNIKGAGNSSDIIHYSAIDTRPIIGTSYYRLKQTDFDGKYEYSAIRSINYHPQSSIQLFPNPAKNQLTIMGSIDELSEFRIYNTVGQEVTSMVELIKDKQNELFFNLSSLRSGLYIIKTKTKTSKVYKK
jgi:hypothetical protein